MKLEKIKIKQTDLNDLKDILEVEDAAFEDKSVVKLTEELLYDKSAEPLLSLLAYDGNEAIGHVLFTKAFIGEKNSSPKVHILAPLAVKPEYQKKGIGGMLINEGLKILKEWGTELVFVLGHIEYYPKFGFINDADSLGFPAPYPIPENVKDAWMVQSFIKDGLNKYSGKFICSEMLDKEEHWRE